LQGARRPRARPARADPHARLTGGSVAGGARGKVLRALRDSDRSRRLAARHQGDHLARPRALAPARRGNLETPLGSRHRGRGAQGEEPPRRPRHPEVKLTRAEADLYQRTTDFLRRLYREGFIQPAEQEETEDGTPRRRTKKGILQLAVIHLRQRLCSSSRALAESLAHL